MVPDLQLPVLAISSNRERSIELQFLHNISMEFVCCVAFFAASVSNLFSFRIKCIFNFGILCAYLISASGIFYSTQCAYFDCHLPPVCVPSVNYKEVITRCYPHSTQILCVAVKRALFFLFQSCSFGLLNSIEDEYSKLLRPDVFYSPLHRFLCRVLIFYFFRHRNQMHLFEIITSRNLETNFSGSCQNIVTSPACIFKRWLIHTTLAPGEKKARH